MIKKTQNNVIGVLMDIHSYDVGEMTMEQPKCETIIPNEWECIMINMGVSFKIVDEWFKHFDILYWQGMVIVGRTIDDINFIFILIFIRVTAIQV